jgi:hypothetical protein
MTEAWVLFVWLASGQPAVFQMPTELACDAEVQAIERLAADETVCPVALAARCLPAIVEGR